MNHILTIDMTKFIGAEIIKRETPDGYEQEGVFIPFARNSIRRGVKGTLYSHYYIIQKKNDMYFNQTHYVVPKYNKSERKELSDLGFDVPYIGHVTPCWDKKINGFASIHKQKREEKYVKINNQESNEDE